jgi:hypothetical protein
MHVSYVHVLVEEKLVTKNKNVWERSYLLSKLGCLEKKLAFKQKKNK